MDGRTHSSNILACMHAWTDACMHGRTHACMDGRMVHPCQSKMRLRQTRAALRGARSAGRHNHCLSAAHVPQARTRQSLPHQPAPAASPRCSCPETRGPC
eukprot:365738-Chlamydomonas_euryale.AAC.25